MALLVSSNHKAQAEGYGPCTQKCAHNLITKRIPMETNLKRGSQSGSLSAGVADSREVRAAHMAMSALAGYSAWMKDYEWSHKIDLTFRYDAGLNTAEREFNAFVRRLEQHVRHAVYFFASIELGTAHGRAHIHAILSNTETVSAETIRSMWKVGRSEAAIYDSRRGAIRYAAKDLVRADASLLIRLPRAGRRFRPR
jgi:hypothetical protein